jgi:CheY-like chemotaxis protein
MARSATVLVVEDEADVREIAVGYISALGYSVLSACDGGEALSILEGDTPIDLLLTDIVMPGLDGITLGRRAMTLRPNLKVLHVTGYAQHLPQAGETGNATIIGKPYRMEQLQARFARMLGTWAVDNNQILSRLHRYWLEKRGTRRWPDRRTIDPAELKEILPKLALIEVLGDEQGPRFRYRLVGTSIVDAYRTNPSGKFIDEVTTGEYRNFILSLLEEVATEGLAIYSSSAFRFEETGLSAERLFLPLSIGNSDRVGQIMMGQTLDWSARKTIALTVAEQLGDRVDTVERLT